MEGLRCKQLLGCSALFSKPSATGLDLPTQMVSCQTVMSYRSQGIRMRLTCHVFRQASCQSVRFNHCPIPVIDNTIWHQERGKVKVPVSRSMEYS